MAWKASKPAIVLHAASEALKHTRQTHNMVIIFNVKLVTVRRVAINCNKSTMFSQDIIFLSAPKTWTMNALTFWYK